eukprot:2141580-Pleurochrysis_carterae.AAC.1
MPGGCRSSSLQERSRRWSDDVQCCEPPIVQCGCNAGARGAARRRGLWASDARAGTMPARWRQ